MLYKIYSCLFSISYANAPKNIFVVAKIHIHLHSDNNKTIKNAIKKLYEK